MLTKESFLAVLDQILTNENLLEKEKNIIENIKKNHNDLPKKITADIIIYQLGLITIKGVTDEDGYFKEFVNTIKDAETESQTDIFYLLKEKQVSCLHALETTETWKWLGGDDILVFILEKNKISEIRLNHENITCTIPENTFFGAKLSSNNNENFSWVTCTCKPGFIPQYYRNPSPEELADFFKTYPDYKQIITELSPKISKNNNSIVQPIIQFFNCCTDIKQTEEQKPLIINQPQNNT